MSSQVHIEGVHLNAAAGEAPDWVQLTPPGPAVVGRDGRRWSLADPERLAAEFNAAGDAIPVDFEHATHLRGEKGEAAPAVGWVDRLEVRDGALWGRVEWLDAGRNAVASRGYRFVSPVLLAERATGAIRRIASVGLTNVPNLRMAALIAEQDASDAEHTLKCEQLGLTPSEQCLLRALSVRAGQAVSKDDLMCALYGVDAASNAKIVDVFICKLREKLRANPPGWIFTVHGRGFRFDPLASPPARGAQGRSRDARRRVTNMQRFVSALETADGRAVGLDEMRAAVWGDEFPDTWRVSLGLLAAKCDRPVERVSGVGYRFKRTSRAV